MIPELFMAVACPEPTPEQYAAVKLEAGTRSGVKKFKRNQKDGKLSEMEKEALEDLVKIGNSEKGANGRVKSTGLYDEPAHCTEVWMTMTQNNEQVFHECEKSEITFTGI